MKLYGPYVCSDGRVRIVIVDETSTTSLSYPKYLMEQHLGRKLLDNEEVHHIDENPLNNELSNLEIKLGTEHRRFHNPPLEPELFICPWCDKSIELAGQRLLDHRRNSKRGSCGPFCNRSCAGKYNQQFNRCLGTIAQR